MPKKEKWKAQSEQLRAAMEVTRAIKAGKDTSQMVIPEADDDRTQCPHCNRKFNTSAAERHIPLCANKSKNQAFKMGPGKKRKW